MKHQAEHEEEAFEEFCREAVYAARADEEVISAAADSPFLFQRVRAQLAREVAPPVKHNWLASLVAARTAAGQLKWSVAAMAVVLIAMGTAMVLLRGARQTLPEPPVAEITTPTVEIAQTPASAPLLQSDGAFIKVSAGYEKRRSLRRSSIKKVEEEVTTEYLPLTYLAYADDADRGHVVRVQMPRAALLTLGVPVGAEPSAELVKADVIVGDDGLARAIRLVR
ncbi:MAG: hypothetical protein M3X11_16240 [Acidobacteriota bacterium]|nr:hypothetical protein [Acidobacteriota bacterium]